VLPAHFPDWRSFDFALGDEVAEYRRFQDAEPDPQPNADEYDAQCKWDAPAPSEKGITGHLAEHENGKVC
jgi:hypothetical protein